MGDCFTLYVRWGFFILEWNHSRVTNLTQDNVFNDVAAFLPSVLEKQGQRNFVDLYVYYQIDQSQAKAILCRGRSARDNFSFEARIALDNIGGSRTERKSFFFSISLTSSSYSRDRNKYGGIWRRSVDLFKWCPLFYCDAIYRRVLLLFTAWAWAIFCHMYFCHVRTTMTSDIGKHDFRSVLLHPMLSVVGSAITKEKTPVPVRSPKLSPVGRGWYLDGWPSR